MKKLAVILTACLLLTGLSVSVWAQAPLAGYQISASTGEAYRELSAAATILWEPTENDELNRRIFLPGNERAELSAVMNGKYAANISLGGDMLFGQKRFSSVAVTADGFVFFGSRLSAGDAADSVSASSNVGNAMMMLFENRNFIYSGFLTERKGDFPSWEAATLKGGDGAKIGYEISGTTVYIGYENIRLYDFSNKPVTLSWNYKLDVDAGTVNLQIKGFSAADKDAFKYIFGLFGTATKTDALWLADWTGKDGVYENQILFSVESGQPEDKTFSFAPPAACQKISDFTMTWDDQWATVSDDEINIGEMLGWNSGNKALFILSKEQSLAGNNMPQDGTYYTDGDRIGSGEVRIGSKDQSGGFVNGRFRNLDPSTTYYCHAFGYNDDCSNVKYSDPATKSFTTLMGAPEADGIVMGAVAETSFKMTLPSPASGLTYLVAVSETSLSDDQGNPLAELVNGQIYTEGQEVVDNFGMYAFVVKKVGAGAGEITIDGLKKGTAYHVAVWHMQGSGAGVTYSPKYTLLGQRTVSKVPVTIDFADEDRLGQPRGWNIGKAEGGYGFEVRTYGEDNGSGLPDEPGYPDGSGVLNQAMAKAAPQSGSKILVSELSYEPEDANAPQTKVMSAYAVSPVFDTASFATVAGIFNLAFLTKTSWDGPEVAYRPQAGDSALISWATVKEADKWNRLVKVDGSTAWDNDGFASVTTPSITPDGAFRFKVDYYRTVDASREEKVMFAIGSVEVEEDLPCKYPTDITVVESGLNATSARLTWEDNNRPSAQAFKLMYQAQGETEWNTVETRDVAYTFENLKPATAYNVQIQAVCGQANNSLVKTVGFTTFDVLPYLIDLTVEGTDVTGLTNYRGALNETLRPIGQDDTEKGWETKNDGFGYPVLQLPLASDANTWLRLPVVASEKNAIAIAKISVNNWAMPEYQTYEEAPKHHDTLWLFMSQTGDFSSADRRVAGFIALDSLKFALDSTESDGMKMYRPQYNEKTIEFEVESGKKYNFAFYIPGIGADPDAEANTNNLCINKIDIDYGTVIYPAVTDIYTDNLGKTNISIYWTTSADSSVVIYKPRSEQKFDTVGTKANHIDLTGLQSGTRYEFYVYGIYGDIVGKRSEQQFFQTIAQCETPSNFAVIQTFWDGARITGHSENSRLIYIKSEGEVGEYYVNSVLEWTPRGDTLRLRGLHVSGVGYPYSVQLRAVCNPGDSSAWTAPLTFKTAEYPQIGTPTNLNSSFNASSRSAVLSWTPGINNDYMYVYYKKAGSYKYDTTGTDARQYVLRNLESNVVYTWFIQPLHDTYLLGDPTDVQEFGTNVANEASEYADALRIRISNRRIVVDNPEGRYIKAVNVYDMAGRQLKNYPVNDKGNVFVNTDLQQGVVLVEVLGASGERAVSKLVVMQ